MKLFSRETEKKALNTPRPAVLPSDDELSVAARYRGSRIGGDYYDFVPVADGRTLFLLTDVAGRRDEALHIASAVQECIQKRGPELLAAPDANLSDGVVTLILELNRVVMDAAGGVRSAPAFLGCLDEQFGMLHYVSAGHTPAFVRSPEEVVQLDPNGLPLGLFSHATHDAQVCVVPTGASVVLVSKGLVEVASGRREFGIERVRAVLAEESFPSAIDLCNAMLDRAVKFTEEASSFGPQFSIPGFRSTHDPNDLTVVCLMRKSATAAAVAGD